MKLFLSLIFIFSCIIVSAQDAGALVGKLKEKLQQVHDYEATGVLKTDVAFIKAPAGKVIV